MVKNERGLVHLAQDEQHLVVNEFLEFLQVAVHLLLQLIPDLGCGRQEAKGFRGALSETAQQAECLLCTWPNWGSSPGF